ncbi:MAG: A/G-specific adenine glycosylase [Micropruina sp.]|jgi:A/G-specific adenine glycosylase|nr:A/G-specific adenine glycosylase [Micropruina sp.]
MVSEVMLQQTPVTRVIGPWTSWLERWPTPADLATEEPGEAVRAWGRLGYPRRAQRLHATAIALVRDHAGEVPDTNEALRALPGIGEYTAAAILAFAFGQRVVVLDTNVRRVLARLAVGQRYAAASLTTAERALAQRWLPDDPATAARWSVAAMELGALVCVAETPDCDHCPVSDVCAYRAAGSPPWDGPPRRTQTYEDTDRQARGALLAVLRSTSGWVAKQRLLAAWAKDDLQAQRALASLVIDGLATEGEGGYRL